MPNAIQLANGPLPQAANTTLTASIPSSGSATPTVASAANLPTRGPFLLVVDNERIEVDSISGSTLTILSGGRAQEGTSAAAHTSGASVYQVLSAATAVRLVDDRTGTVLAPDPTGVAATDKSNLDALTSTANRVIQLRPGTYLCNPLATLADGVVLQGWRNRQTILQLAVQASDGLVNLGVGGGLVDLVVDGNRAFQTWAGDQYTHIVDLADGAFVRDCLFQNIKTSAMGVYGGQHVETPQLTTLTTSTAGGSLPGSTALVSGDRHHRRGETQPSQELSVTTGAGSSNSNTLRARWTAPPVTRSTTPPPPPGNGTSSARHHRLGPLSPTRTPRGRGAHQTPDGRHQRRRRVNNLAIDNNEITTTFGRGVYLENSPAGSHNNRITAIGDRGIRLSGAPIGQTATRRIDILIDNNQLDYSAMTTLDAGTSAIEVWNRLHTIISNNQVVGPADDCTTTNYLGISVGGNCDETIVVGNTIRKSNPNGRNNAIYIGIENAGNQGVVIEANNIRGCNSASPSGRSTSPPVG